MDTTDPPLADMVAAIRAAPISGRRRLVALAGPPASGKSTLAASLATDLTSAGTATVVVPMDGFHLHNRVLRDRHLMDRKGAPQTFDVQGLGALVRRLNAEDEVFFPVFDRARDIAIAGGGMVGPDCETVVIEGNYLLFDAPGWRTLQAYWDFSVRLDVPLDALKERLVARWLAHGLPAAQAHRRASQNDLANALLVTGAPLPADIVVSGWA
ncbi:nucleoside/nucleotide kinase family protein [uncultured Sulfitobacter sp.]|uniref:nucleoside/nucleotide kinase family protein n=1 Tax=uncultured Sulfitobacter sp. TaxID=191468 RepID=UPI00261A6A35|nr:nucleoside/nucleotide kinase family protein [uncultured Sulfitobacter sp.]